MIWQKSKINRTLKIAVGIIAVVVAACVIDSLFYENQNPLSPISANKGENGLWLRYFWYAGKHADAKDWQEMLTRLRVNQIKYAFFHVLTTTPDGSLKLHKLENAKKITESVHAAVPGTKVIAWVYVGAAPQPDGLDLNSEAVRKKLISEALWLTNDCGFDGVQWDYEFAANKSPALPKLLRETRAALPAGKFISVDTPMWYPGTLWGWSKDYFTDVAAECDQVCVMCYDSYLPLPRAYAWLMAQQVLNVSEAVAEANHRHHTQCRLLLGVPTYEDRTPAHRHEAESFANALRGISLGLRLPGTVSDVIDGIAIFADYTTDHDEWQAYQNYWLHSSRVK